MIKVEIYPERTTRGDSFSFMLEFFEEVPGTPPLPPTEVPFDLSVYDQIIMDVRETDENSPLIFNKKLSTGGIVIEGEGNNKLAINVTSEESERFGSGIYYYDVRFLVGTRVKTLLHSNIIVSSNITSLE
jgi:hypothetical protein